jgi:1-pyrroline-5-carboxylate dehydrogenase
MKEKKVEDFFTKLVQRVMPKSDGAARGEVKGVRIFLENYSADAPRFLTKAFKVTGDRVGQQTGGYRWPFGAVLIISPFNFPLKLPCIQMVGALMCGNRVTIKGDQRGAICIEQFLRLLFYCGLPRSDVDLVHMDGPPMEKVIRKFDFRCIQFTGSSKIADHLSDVTHGKVKIEDSGFDWKVLGPDVDQIDYVAWQSDQDSFSMSGQQCSAQSFLICHKNW